MKPIHFTGSGRLEATTDISTVVYMKSNNLKQSLASTFKVLKRVKRRQEGKEGGAKCDRVEEKGTLSK